MAGVTQTGVELSGAAAKGGAHQSNSDDQELGSGGVKRADPIEIYEKELRTAWWWAFIISSLHACSRFVSKCNLICATVVLLGAFVPYLVPTDFNFVVSLLLLDGVRFSCVAFFTRFFRRALACLSQNPKSINHSQDEHYSRTWWARISSLLLQLICIFPGLFISGTRLFFSKLDDYNAVDARNVQKSLRIFYSSVFFNSVLALINLLCSAIATLFVLWRNFPTEQSILRYYDKLLENAMASGVMQADDFEFFHFAFVMLAAEFGRNVQPEAVAKNHKQLIHYIYAHRLGVDFLQIYLNAEDAFLQLAAVNVVGFWADRVWGVGVPKLRLPEELLTKLADKVGTGQVGWAATSSFGAIAASSPHGAQMVERTCTSGGVRLPDRLAHLVDDSSSRSLSLVRTLVVIYEQLCEGKEEAPGAFGGGEFVAKLKKLAERAERHRLRVQAAYLLRLMNEACTARVILKIDPTQDSYWFDSEVSMLQLLRQATKAPPFEFLEPHDRPVLRKDHKRISPLDPTWAQAPPASHLPKLL